MKTLFRGGFPLFLLLAGPAWAAPDVIGTLDAFDGTITVVRGGGVLASDKIDTGFAFENNDQLRVSSDGWADVALDNKNGIRANLHVKSGTSVMLDLSSLVPGQKGSLDLLLGSLSLKVQKMTGANGLDVHTETATMGVRGTVFDVDTEVDGSVLLTTTEGKVELAPESGASHFSIPGTAVKSEGEDTPQWLEERVSDPQAYAATWHQQRAQLFAQRRDAVLARLAARYKLLSGKFEAAHQRLEENRELWKNWIDEETAGHRSQPVADAKLRLRIAANLQYARRLAWSLERVDQRLANIENRVGPAFADLKVPLSRGTWKDFITAWHAERSALEAKLALTHYRVKLFALRHGLLSRDSVKSRD